MGCNIVLLDDGVRAVAGVIGEKASLSISQTPLELRRCVPRVVEPAGQSRKRRQVQYSGVARGRPPKFHLDPPPGRQPSSEYLDPPLAAKLAS